MKMTERIKRNMKADKPMTLISLRLPEHVIGDLKEVAPSLGFGGIPGADSGLYLEWAARSSGRAGGATGQGQYGGGDKPEADGPWGAGGGDSGGGGGDEGGKVNQAKLLARAHRSAIHLTRNWRNEGRLVIGQP